MSEVIIILPKDRLGVLIGKGGKVKTRIEKTLKTIIEVDEVGVVKIRQSKSGGDPIKILKAQGIVTAISKGFAPEKSFKLMDDEKLLDVIDLREIYGRKDNQIKRVKGRIIGREGKTRRLIEELLGVDVSVYGHTVSIIGGFETITLAKEAIKMLLKGKQHSTVYRFLRLKRIELKKRAKVELWISKE
ncbi:MAG: RNA-processing protein [Candidatus Aenigmarchaeota archaeon]|nr:RNA-processing protein [Candidatus Aenigmarchaeota archaeon]